MKTKFPFSEWTTTLLFLETAVPQTESYHSNTTLSLMNCQLTVTHQGEISLPPQYSGLHAEGCSWFSALLFCFLCLISFYSLRILFPHLCIQLLLEPTFKWTTAMLPDYFYAARFGSFFRLS